MKNLSTPSRELASRILKEVKYEQRFAGTKMTPMAGNRLTSIYSFEEAVQFLHVDDLGDLMSMGSGASIGYLNLKWLGRVDETVFEEDPKKEIVSFMME